MMRQGSSLLPSTSLLLRKDRHRSYTAVCPLRIHRVLLISTGCVDSLAS